MKVVTALTFLLYVLSNACSNMNDFEFSYENAHPNAKALMKDEFFWSPVEETAPFGSDDGWEAAHGFRTWRIQNRTGNPVTFVKELIKEWDYPLFDYNELDTAKIIEYMSQGPPPDENKIREQIPVMKEALKNSADSLMRTATDEDIRKSIVSSSKAMRGRFLVGQDNAIIGTGFAQFALEGYIDNDIRRLTITAIKRQLLPVLINRYDDENRVKRTAQLAKMAEVMNKANSSGH